MTTKLEAAPEGSRELDAALITMLIKAVRFADWAAGEGICPVSDEEVAAPEEFLLDYWQATGTDDLDHVFAILKVKDARIAELEAERDLAIEQRNSTIGEMAKTEAKIAELEAEIERMTPRSVAYDYLESPAMADEAEAALKAAQDAQENNVRQIGRLLRVADQNGFGDEARAVLGGKPS